MEIAFRIGNHESVHKINIDCDFSDISHLFKKNDTGYSLEIENKTYQVNKGYAINSFRVYHMNDKVMSVYCGFGDERKNELTYRILNDRHSSAVRKGGTWPNFKRLSSPYFMVVFESLHDYPKNLITKIAQLVYIAVKKGLITFDWNGTKSL